MHSCKKTLGILGGGQLGMMLTKAAHKLGIEVVIFSDKEDCPASHVANKTIVARYSDKSALKRFIETVEVVTFESENIPFDFFDSLNWFVDVHPNPEALRITQDRLLEKQFVNALGIVTAKFEKLSDNITLNYPIIVKTRKLGYDGKGQHLINSSNDLALWKFVTQKKHKDYLQEVNIVEEVVKFKQEISVITARDLHGNIEIFPIPKNIHKNGILHTSIVPADINDEIKKKAQNIAKIILEKLNYIGVLAVELFLTENGELIVNEIAPRVHNSGHWSVEACNASQFEQHVRAVCGLPLQPLKLHYSCEMHNLIGNDINNIDKIQCDKKKRVTLYGKKEIKDSRKMGHFVVPLNKESCGWQNL